jgi:hypothetical protein
MLGLGLSSFSASMRPLGFVWGSFSCPDLVDRVINGTLRPFVVYRV